MSSDHLALALTIPDVITAVSVVNVVSSAMLIGEEEYKSHEPTRELVVEPTERCVNANPYATTLVMLDASVVVPSDSVSALCDAPSVVLTIAVSAPSIVPSTSTTEVPVPSIMPIALPDVVLVSDDSTAPDPLDGEKFVMIDSDLLNGEILPFLPKLSRYKNDLLLAEIEPPLVSAVLAELLPPWNVLKENVLNDPVPPWPGTLPTTMPYESIPPCLDTLKSAVSLPNADVLPTEGSDTTKTMTMPRTVLCYVLSYAV